MATFEHTLGPQLETSSEVVDSTSLVSQAEIDHTDRIENLRTAGFIALFGAGAMLAHVGGLLHTANS